MERFPRVSLLLSVINPLPISSWPPLFVQSDVMRTGLRGGCACPPGRRSGPRSWPDHPVNITRDWTLAAAAVCDGVVPAPPSSAAWPFGRGKPAPGVFASLRSTVFLEGLSVRDAIPLSTLRLGFASPGSSILWELRWSLMEHNGASRSRGHSRPPKIFRRAPTRFR